MHNKSYLSGIFTLLACLLLGCGDGSQSPPSDETPGISTNHSRPADDGAGSGRSHPPFKAKPAEPRLQRHRAKTNRKDDSKHREDTSRHPQPANGRSPEKREKDVAEAKETKQAKPHPKPSEEIQASPPIPPKEGEG